MTFAVSRKRDAKLKALYYHPQQTHNPRRETSFRLIFFVCFYLFIYLFLRHNNRYQWLQIDVGRLSKIIRLGTQGRALASQWVVLYYLSSSIDGIHFVRYRKNSRDKVRSQASHNGFISCSVAYSSINPPLYNNPPPTHR